MHSCICTSRVTCMQIIKKHSRTIQYLHTSLISIRHGCVSVKKCHRQAQFFFCFDRSSKWMDSVHVHPGDRQSAGQNSHRTRCPAFRISRTRRGYCVHFCLGSCCCCCCDNAQRCGGVERLASCDSCTGFCDNFHTVTVQRRHYQGLVRAKRRKCLKRSAPVQYNCSARQKFLYCSCIALVRTL